MGRVRVIARSVVFRAVAIAVALAFVCGCSTRPITAELGPTVRIPSRPVVLFFADGIRCDYFRSMLREGKLPNIKRYLVDRGTVVRYALTSLPSITYAITTTMLTGRQPGHHDVLGNHFFDRSSLLMRDYTYIKTYRDVERDYRCPNIFELLSDRFTVSVQVPNRRGVTRNIDNWMSSGISWYFHLFENVDGLVAYRFELITELANAAGRWPDFVFAYMPACDEIGHRYGSDSRQYRHAIMNMDRQVGRVCRHLQRLGLLDRCTLVFVSDHGHIACDRNSYFDIERFLTDRLGLAATAEVYDDRHSFEDRLKHFSKFRVVLVNGGYRRFSLHLRAGEHWYVRPTVRQVLEFHRLFGHPAAADAACTLPRLLAAQPAVAAVVFRQGPNMLRVVSNRGEATIERAGPVGPAPSERKSYRYRVVSGRDPLGYEDHPQAARLCDGAFHGAGQWLDATLQTDAPDFVYQVSELFDSPRVGDIVAFARPGWDFSKMDVGGHGSFFPQEMFVPMVFAGPGIQRGAAIRTGRVVDLMPTVIDLMGLSDRLKNIGPLDGVSLAGQLCPVAHLDLRWLQRYHAFCRPVAQPTGR